MSSQELFSTRSWHEWTFFFFPGVGSWGAESHTIRCSSSWSLNSQKSFCITFPSTKTPTMSHYAWNYLLLGSYYKLRALQAYYYHLTFNNCPLSLMGTSSSHTWRNWGLEVIHLTWSHSAGVIEFWTHSQWVFAARIALCGTSGKCFLF